MHSEAISGSLEDARINVKFKLSALWASATLCYIYGDIVALYQPGAIDGILSGKMGPLGPATQELLLGVAVFMSIPCTMVFLSLILKPKANRLLNIVFGIVYTVVMILTMLPGPWAFYIFLGIIEVIVTMLVVWHAWHWPRVPGHGENAV